MEDKDFLKTATILYVEDEDDVREGYARVLSRYAKELYLAENGEVGLELFKKHAPDIVITDIRMPKKNGIDMAKEIKEINPNQSLIFTTAHGESTYLLEAIEVQADAYILKPVAKDVLKNKIIFISKALYFEKERENYKKELEQKVEDQIEALREKDRELFRQMKKAAMGDLIGIIAHQLKQPLNAIELASYLVKEDFEYGELDKEEIDKCYERIHKNVSFMTESIDELRNFFRPNKRPAPYSLKNAIEKALSIIALQIRSKGIEIVTELETDKEISGYQNEFQQVILNIVTNGKDILMEREIPSAYIKISTFENQEGRTVVEIKDNGGGIEEGIIEHVFDSYFTTKGEEGTGIGLNLAKMIVEDSMGGTISVKNGDEGAVFTIEV